MRERDDQSQHSLSVLCICTEGILMYIFLYLSFFLFLFFFRFYFLLSSSSTSSSLLISLNLSGRSLECVRTTHWNGLTTLYNANIWAPSVIPLETFIAVIGGVTNFELVFRVKEMNGVVLEKMVRLLRDMHKDIGGRTELRFGTGVVFWDLSLTKSFGKPFNLLAENFGVKRLALHPGKYQPRNIKTTMKKCQHD